MKDLLATQSNSSNTIAFLLLAAPVFLLPADGNYQIFGILLIFCFGVFFSLTPFAILKIIFFLLIVGILTLSQDPFLGNMTAALFFYSPFVIFLSHSYRNAIVGFDNILIAMGYLYSFLIFFQLLQNNFIPDFADGIHGVQNGAHISGILLLTLGTYYLNSAKITHQISGVFFLITGILCGYNIVTLVVIISHLIYYLFQTYRGLNSSKALVYLVPVMLISIYIFFSDRYASSIFNLALRDIDFFVTQYALKISYMSDSLKSIYENNFFVGEGLGQGGSKGAIISIYNLGIEFFNSIPDWTREHVLDYYNLLYFYPGTLHQPYSSLIAILSEMGLLGGIIILFGLLLRTIQFAKESSAPGIAILLLQFWLLLILTHSLENYVYISLLLLLTSLNPSPYPTEDANYEIQT